MPSELINFKFEHLSVGNAFQNLAFYSLVAFMVMVLVVQTNEHHETGARKFVLTRAARFSHALYWVYHEMYLALRRLFVSRL